MSGIGPDNTLPGDLPSGQEPGSPNQDLPHEIVIDKIQNKVKTPLDYMKMLYPKYFSPDPIDPEVVDAMLEIAEEMRPKCLSPRLQMIAQVHYAAYLLEEQLKQTDASEGGSGAAMNSGIILSEKEGDLTVTYADPRTSTSIGTSVSDTQPSTAWGKWKKMWDVCAIGAITTRFGRPPGA